MHKTIITWTDKKINGVNANSLTMLCGGVSFHTHAKVVGIMRQNACTLAFCVHQLLQNLALV